MAPYLSHEGWRKENKPIFSHSGALIKRGTAEQWRRPRLLPGKPNASSLRYVKLSSVLSRRGLRVLAAALSSRPAEVRGHQVSAVRTCVREREGKEIRVKAARAVKTAEVGGKKKVRLVRVRGWTVKPTPSPHVLWISASIVSTEAAAVSLKPPSCPTFPPSSPELRRVHMLLRKNIRHLHIWSEDVSSGVLRQASERCV